MEYDYHLQKYAGPASRHTCPSCGGKRCFTLYVDNDGNPLHETVGRCDHESGCNYHYTPRQYFKDHPEARPNTEDWRKTPEWLDKSVHQRPPCPPVHRVDKVDTISDDIVARSIRPTLDSDFITFLRTLFDPITVSSLIQEYRIGGTREKAVIFYQIDIQGRCRTGKVMKYDPETGHRIKDENTKGRITWVHSLMKYAGQLPQEWTLTQCLFGEHLLPLFPEKPVALVESEKTAIICAGLIPKFIWLATGGKSQINSRLDVLKGRSVTAFPDIDGYETWNQKLAQLEGLSYTVADLLVKYGKPEDHEAHIDIADWLIRWHRTPNPRAYATFAAVAQYFSPEVHEEIRVLIHDLDLKFVGVEKMEKENNSEKSEENAAH